MYSDCILEIWSDTSSFVYISDFLCYSPIFLYFSTSALMGSVDYLTLPAYFYYSIYFLAVNDVDLKFFIFLLELLLDLTFSISCNFKVFKF